MSTKKENDQVIKSPCVNICFLDENDVCSGCYRTGAEISQWGRMKPEQQLAVIELVKQREKASAFVS
ncbi:DUF1289 domain-containing protein [Marinomonas piezotolerans]|uniref:DUF1289 domain-containing protein n=1 Tax=Marinomonas piezotolerans TaxID=2213058 RepID=A0A370U809_9GAMM|nr:DUF1289 domain-containing protein [Marinomonas piezotolerans]RDL43878.1 DUF1289 domain-containing protein [Marinomonas piezotolerans]